MKRFMGRLGLTLTVLAAAGAVVFFTPALRVPVDVWGINAGIIPPDRADWNYLSQGSGEKGRKALKTLARHGASDDIRITADYMLVYLAPHRMCGDTLCAKPDPNVVFHPVKRAEEMVTDLRPGQTLPHAFVIDTANTLSWCGKQNPDCVLRMQDFDGDGQAEVYVETLRRIAPGQAEDESRSVVIYCNGEDGWSRCARVVFRNYDGRNWPQRPFVLEVTAMDDLVVNGTSFHFVRQPYYSFSPWSQQPDGATPDMKALGATVGQIPVVLPKEGKLPADLITSLRSGAVSLTPVAVNPPLPMPYLNHGLNIEYTRLPSCESATTCRAIVADLDHDGRDEVILIDDPDSADALRPLNATLLKSDSKTWRVTANIDLCKEIVPDLGRARVELKPSTQHFIRLGANSYPVERNTGCDTGFRLP